MNNFKKGDLVRVFRAPALGIPWPGGAAARKNGWVESRKVLEFSHPEYSNSVNAMVMDHERGLYTIPLDCLVLAKKKPTIIINVLPDDGREE